MKTSSRLYDIPILEENGTNFQTWKYRICTVLDICGLLNIAEGKEQCPSQTLVTGMGDDAAKAHAAQIEKTEDWDCCNKEAKAQITLTLSDEPLSGVIHAVSAADAWDKLNRRYEGRGHQTIAQLIGKIFRTTFTNDSPLEPQMNTIRHKAHILQTLNYSLTDSLVAIAIIHSLPETYSTLKTILLSTPEDKLSSDAIINHILVEEKSQKSQSTSQTTFVAHLGKGKGKVQDKGKGGQGKGADGKPKLGKCAYCKKKGHYKAECRKMKHDLEEKDEGGSEKKSTEALRVKVARAKSDNDDEHIHLFMAQMLQEQKAKVAER